MENNVPTSATIQDEARSYHRLLQSKKGLFQGQMQLLGIHIDSGQAPSDSKFAGWCKEHFIKLKNEINALLRS